MNWKSLAPNKLKVLLSCFSHWLDPSRIELASIDQVQVLGSRMYTARDWAHVLDLNQDALKSGLQGLDGILTQGLRMMMALNFSVASCRRKQELTAGLLKGLIPGTPPEVMEQEIIDKILTLQYTSWPTCHGSYNATMNGTSIAKAEGEARDGWLDYDACDDRLLRGVGQCIRSILK